MVVYWYIPLLWLFTGRYLYCGCLQVDKLTVVVYWYWIPLLWLFNGRGQIREGVKNTFYR